MEEEEDDIYDTSAASQVPGAQNFKQESVQPELKQDAGLPEHGNEEGEESEDESDSDIDIITEREPGAADKTSTPQPPRQDSKIQIKAPLSETNAGHDESPLRRGTQSRPAADSTPGHEYPEVHVSKMETDANPEYEPVGKPITELDFDADLAEHDKPWRRPGADQSDYFNYGFDEFTWATYCMKQKNMRNALNEQKAESKQFEMMFGGQAGMGMSPQGAPSGPAQGNTMPPLGSMPGMPDMSPDMMSAMMQQMMATGMDPSQIGPMEFANMMQQMQGGMPPNQGYGSGSGMIDQNHMQPNQGFGGGRGRGRRGRW